MIIFQNGFLTLDYDPRTDVVYVHIPDVSNLFMEELSKSYDVIVDHVRSYDVKRLLLDATHTTVEVEEAAFTRIIFGFASGLRTTRLEKVARVISSVPLREAVVKKVFTEMPLALQFKTFTDSADAMGWLMER